MTFLVFSKRGAVHSDQTSPPWSGLSKAHCSRSLDIICSDASLQAQAVLTQPFFRERMLFPSKQAVLAQPFSNVLPLTLTC